jgi:hypothetical protein
MAHSESTADADFESVEVIPDAAVATTGLHYQPAQQPSSAQRHRSDDTRQPQEQQPPTPGDNVGSLHEDDVTMHSIQEDSDDGEKQNDHGDSAEEAREGAEAAVTVQEEVEDITAADALRPYSPGPTEGTDGPQGDKSRMKVGKGAMRSEAALNKVTSVLALRQDITSTGFAGVANFVREVVDNTGAHVFTTYFITVFVGDAVCFRWWRPGYRIIEVDDPKRPHQPLQGGTHSEKLEQGNQGTFIVPMKEKSERHFAIEDGIGKAICTVRVIERDSVFWRAVLWYALLTVGVLGVVTFATVFLVVWARGQDFITSFADVKPSEDNGQYTGLNMIEDLLVTYSLPWFVATVLLVIVTTAIRMIRWCHRPLMSSFGRGFEARKQRRVQIISGTWLVALAAAVLALWVFLLRANFGFAEVFRVLNQSVNNSLNDVLSVVRNMQYIIARAPEVLHADVPESAHTLLIQVNNTANNVLVWSENGDNVVRGVLRAFAIASFLSLQFVLYSTAAGLAGVRERSAKMMRLTAYLMGLSTALMCFSVGFAWLNYKVMDLTYTTTTKFNEKALSTEQLQENTGMSKDSPLIQLFGACTENGVLSVTYLDGMLHDVISKWNNESGTNKELALSLSNNTLVTVEGISQYADFVGSQLDELDRRLAADPDSFRDIIPNFQDDFAPLLRSAIAVAKSLLGLVDCRVLRNTLFEALPVLKTEVVDTLRVQVALYITIIGMSLVAIVLSSITAHVFARPLKFWHEASTDRWFRFRCSWRAHTRILRAHGGPPKEPTRWSAPSNFTKPFILVSVYITNNLNSFMACLQAAMLIIVHYSYSENRLNSLLQAVAYLCATAPVFAIPTELFHTTAIRITLRSVSLATMVAATICSIVYTAQAAAKTRDCYDQLAEGRQYVNSSVYPFTPNCSADRIARELETGVYSCTVGAVCFVSVVTTVILLRFVHFRATTAITDVMDAREEDRGTIAARKHRHKVRQVVTIVCSVVGFVVAVGIVTAAVLANVLGDSTQRNPDIYTIPSDRANACNGYPELCAKQVHEVVWASTHNSFSSLEDRYVAPNHYYSLKMQLEAGFRSFMVDLWQWDKDPTKPYLCHKYCALGAIPFESHLRLINEFLDANKREVVMIIIEQGVQSSNITAAVQASGIEGRVWTPPETAGTPASAPDTFEWPTLGSLVESDKRILIFTDEAPGSERNPRPTPPWLLYMWDYMVENAYEFKNITELDCAFKRGNTNNTGALSRKITILNHFLTAPMAAPFLASAANAHTVVQSHWDTCRRTWGRAPNVFAFDYWNVNEPLRVMDGLNKLLISGG